MKLSRSLLLLLLQLTLSCSSTQGPAVPAPKSLDIGHPGVFFEAAVVDVAAADVDTIASRCTADFACWKELASQSTVFSSPHVLTESDHTATLSLPAPKDAPPPKNVFDAALRDYSFEVTPHVREPNRVQVDLVLRLANRGAPRELKATWIAGDGDVTVKDTGVESNGRHLIVLVRPTVIRTQADVREVFERKVRERDALIEKKSEDAAKVAPHVRRSPAPP